VSQEATDTVSAELDYPDYVETLRAREPDLAEEFARFTGITAVLDWMKRRGLTGTAVDIVGQDEFYYDFLIQMEPAGRWLSFGVT
jgi:hypothetical protein